MIRCLLFLPIVLANRFLPSLQKQPSNPNVIAVADTGVDIEHCSFVDHGSFFVSGQLIGREYHESRGDFARLHKKHRLIDAYIHVASVSHLRSPLSHVADQVGTHGTHTLATVLGQCHHSEGSKWNGLIKQNTRVVIFDLPTLEEVGHGDIVETPQHIDKMLEIAYSKYDVRVFMFLFGTEQNYFSKSARQITDFVKKHPDMLVVIAAGNDGPVPYSIGEPATAYNIFSIGAAPASIESFAFWKMDVMDGLHSHFSFSSIGPTFDGRIAPTFCSIGGPIGSAAAHTVNNVSMKMGTSQAAPVFTACLIATRDYLLRQYPELMLTMPFVFGALIHKRKIQTCPEDHGCGYGRVTPHDVPPPLNVIQATSRSIQPTENSHSSLQRKQSYHLGFGPENDMNHTSTLLTVSYIVEEDQDLLVDASVKCPNVEQDVVKPCPSSTPLNGVLIWLSLPPNCTLTLLTKNVRHVTIIASAEKKESKPDEIGTSSISSIDNEKHTPYNTHTTRRHNHMNPFILFVAIILLTIFISQIIEVSKSPQFHQFYSKRKIVASGQRQATFRH